jgi:hypothetical protein
MQFGKTNFHQIIDPIIGSRARTIAPLFVLSFVSIALLTACNRQPVATATPTVLPIEIQALTFIANTVEPLPPTWTPTFTPTPRPSATPIPTQTPLPTLSLENACDTFAVTFSPRQNGRYAFNSVINFGWSGVPPGHGVVLNVTIRGGVAGVRLDAPIDDDYIIPIVLSSLPGSGIYDWTIFVNSPSYGAICIQRGVFEKLPPNAFF